MTSTPENVWKTPLNSQPRWALSELAKAALLRSHLLPQADHS